MIRSNGQLFAVKSTTNFCVVSENEYHILRSLDSPFIVRCLGCCYSVENGVGEHNLFMEYLSGGSLADLLTKFGGRLDESVIRAYTHGSLCGIHYLQRQGIVHCDIKGKNVLVGASGVKLADFGSAKRIGDEGEGREPLQLRGTLLWMVPEVLNQVEQGLLLIFGLWAALCWRWPLASSHGAKFPISSPISSPQCIESDAQKSCLSFLHRFHLGSEISWRNASRDPKTRWTSAELLHHPFLNKDFSAIKEEKAIRATLSPTSNLDFANQLWDSYSSQTTPILSLNIPSPAGKCNPEADSERSIQQCPRPSPRDRVLALASSCVADRCNWSASSPGQWIVVRSSKDSPPTPDNLLPISDNLLLNQPGACMQRRRLQFWL